MFGNIMYIHRALPGVDSSGPLWNVEPPYKQEVNMCLPPRGTLAHS